MKKALLEQLSDTINKSSLLVPLSKSMSIRRATDIHPLGSQSDMGFLISHKNVKFVPYKLVKKTDSDSAGF